MARLRCFRTILSEMPNRPAISLTGTSSTHNSKTSRHRGGSASIAASRRRDFRSYSIRSSGGASSEGGSARKSPNRKKLTSVLRRRAKSRVRLIAICCRNAARIRGGFELAVPENAHVCLLQQVGGILPPHPAGEIAKEATLLALEKSVHGIRLGVGHLKCLLEAGHRACRKLLRRLAMLEAMNLADCLPYRDCRALWNGVCAAASLGPVSAVLLGDAWGCALGPGAGPTGGRLVTPAGETPCDGAREARCQKDGAAKRDRGNQREPASMTQLAHSAAWTVIKLARRVWAAAARRAAVFATWGEGLPRSSVHWS